MSCETIRTTANHDVDVDNSRLIDQQHSRIIDH